MNWAEIWVNDMLKQMINGALFSLAVSLVVQSTAMAESQKESVSSSLFEKTHLYYKQGIFDKMIVLDLSPAWWARFDGSDSKGVNALQYVTRDVGLFAKNMGWTENLEDFEFACEGPKEAAKPRVDPLVATIAPKFKLTVEAKTPTVDDQRFELAMKYLESTAEVLADKGWKAPAGTANIKIVMNPAAKAITVTGSPDKKSFTIVAPVDVDANEKVDTIYNGLVRNSR